MADPGRRAMLALRDSAVPGLSAVVGRQAKDLVGGVLAPAGGTLRRLRTAQVAYHPGRSITAQLDVRVGWPGGATTDEVLVATTGGTLPEGVAVLEHDERGAEVDAPVGVWRVPADPLLPGLAAALDPARVARLLEDLGLPPGPDPVALRFRSYRPTRRAVVEATGRGGRLFLKVVPPHKAEALHEHHQRLSACLPVPPSHGWSPELGLVVLGALSGQTLLETLFRGDGPFPPADEIVALLDGLPAVPDGMAPMLAMPDRVAHYATLLAAVVPGEADRIERLTSALSDPSIEPGVEPGVPVHGDLHEAQILVTASRVSGLLDVDTACLGHRVDDLANLLGHLSTLALVSHRRATIEAYATHLLAAFDRLVDPARLRRHAAAVSLGLATGPFRVQEPDWPARTRERLDLAERWLATVNHPSLASTCWPT